MAAGKRREQRLVTVEQASMVWAMMGDVGTSELEQFVERGTMPAGKSERGVPITPAVARHIDRIQANGGKFVMPD